MLDMSFSLAFLAAHRKITVEMSVATTEPARNREATMARNPLPVPMSRTFSPSIGPNVFANSIDTLEGAKAAEHSSILILKFQWGYFISTIRLR
jgi:hypothetical protein